MQVILSWALYRTNPSEPSKTELKKLRKAVVQVVQQCDELIQFGVANVQKEAFITVRERWGILGVIVFFCRIAQFC